MIEPVKLTSMVSQRLWLLKKSDPERFKREVKAYFARVYPNDDLWHVCVDCHTFLDSTGDGAKYKRKARG